MLVVSDMYHAQRSLYGALFVIHGGADARALSPFLFCIRAAVSTFVVTL